MTPAPNTATAPLDALRARRTSLRRALAGAAALLAKEQRENADTVAETGEMPKAWPARLAHLNADVASLQDAIARLEIDVRAALGADRLNIAKREQQRIPVQRTLDRLFFERAAFFTAALVSAKVLAPMPADFAPKCAALEEQLAATVAQLATIDGEIAEAAAPIHRHEHDEIADRQHAA